MITELIARVFATRNAAHAAHWKTTRYAEHVALGSFYDDLVSSIDEIVEVYQGQFGLVGGLPGVPSVGEDITEHIRDEGDWIETNRDELSNGSACLGSMIDNLSALYCKTYYLLSLR